MPIATPSFVAQVNRAEGGPARRPPAHPFERALGETDQPDAMMDAAGSEPTLGDLEATASAS